MCVIPCAAIFASVPALALGPHQNNLRFVCADKNTSTCVSVCVTCSATTTHLFVPLPPQRRLNLTKTVRKTAISNDLQKVGGVTVDNIKHDPKYDEEGLYVSCWAGCLGLN